MFPIRGLHKTTLVDYPSKVACTVFLGGCNFRCGFCHNSDIVFNEIEPISEDEIFAFLEKRRPVLDAVCITGGEPTLYKELEEFCKKIKDLGYLVKLDTNGTNPELVRQLIEKELIDYVAMDVKGPLDHYNKITNIKVNTDNIKETIQLLINSNIDYEFRTTIVPDIHTEQSFEEIAQLIKGAKKYYIQQFRPDEKVIDKKYAAMKPVKKQLLDNFKKSAEKELKCVEVRD